MTDEKENIVYIGNVICNNCPKDNVDTKVYGYDWHEHEFRFVCVPSKGNDSHYTYCPMRKPWHDMTDEERCAEIDWAYKEIGKICDICKAKRYLT